jgi:NADH:ubiquinone oxidoreductase subunit 4 (subunit M)
MMLGVFVLMTWQLLASGSTSTPEEKKKMGWLSLAIWTPIAVRRACCWPLGRESNAACALDGADRFPAQLPGHLAADHRLRLGTPAMQFVEKLPWIERFNVNYHLGVDGISVWFVLLTAFITIIVVIAGWEGHRERVPVHGRLPDPVGPDGRRVQCARRLLFYVFFEATLIPMYIIIGIWGGPRRVYAAFKFFLYTLLGSLLMLVALIYLYCKSGGSFDDPRLAQAAAADARADAAVLRVLCRLLGQGADVAGAHLAARRARRGAHRRLGGAGGHHAEAGRLRLPALLAADRARRQRANGPGS